jgi:hypothetical protein
VNLSAIPYRHGLRSVVGGVRVSDYADLLKNRRTLTVFRGRAFQQVNVICRQLQQRGIVERLPGAGGKLCISHGTTVGGVVQAVKKYGLDATHFYELEWPAYMLVKNAVQDAFRCPGHN